MGESELEVLAKALESVYKDGVVYTVDPDKKETLKSIVENVSEYIDKMGGRISDMCIDQEVGIVEMTVVAPAIAIREEHKGKTFEEIVNNLVSANISVDTFESNGEVEATIRLSGMCKEVSALND